MNIDDLINSIDEIELRDNLNHWVCMWKSDESDIDNLYELVAKWHGNVWFKEKSKQNEFWDDLQSLKKVAINGLGGMTLNERLYLFGLSEEWEASSEVGQRRIRNKLHAPA